MTSIRRIRTLIVSTVAIVLTCALSPSAFAGKDASILDWNPRILPSRPAQPFTGGVRLTGIGGSKV